MQLGLLLLSLVVSAIYCPPIKSLHDRSSSSDQLKQWFYTASDKEDTTTKKVEAKSIFVVPKFDVILPMCGDGFRQGLNGRCVKIYAGNWTEHWNFILKKLKDSFGETVQTSEGPLRLTIPLGEID